MHCKVNLSYTGTSCAVYCSIVRILISKYWPVLFVFFLFVCLFDLDVQVRLMNTREFLDQFKGGEMQATFPSNLSQTCSVLKAVGTCSHVALGWHIASDLHVGTCCLGLQRG